MIKETASVIGAPNFLMMAPAIQYTAMVEIPPTASAAPKQLLIGVTPSSTQ